MAVGNCLQLSTGSGWDVLQWRGWARPEPRRGCAQACPGCSGFVHAWNGPPGAALEYKIKTAPKGRRRHRGDYQRVTWQVMEDRKGTVFLPVSSSAAEPIRSVVFALVCFT